MHNKKYTGWLSVSFKLIFCYQLLSTCHCQYQATSVSNQYWCCNQICNQTCYELLDQNIDSLLSCFFIKNLEIIKFDPVTAKFNQLL